MILFITLFFFFQEEQLLAFAALCALAFQLIFRDYCAGLVRKQEHEAEAALCRRNAGQRRAEGASGKCMVHPAIARFRSRPSGLRKCIRPLISQPLLATRP